MSTRIRLAKIEDAPTMARFTQTHGQWDSGDNIKVEDLLVVLADKCWKGHRNQELEQRIIDEIAKTEEQDLWEVFVKFDDMIEDLASRADLRLEWQAKFSVNVSSAK